MGTMAHASEIYERALKVVEAAAKPPVEIPQALLPLLVYWCHDPNHMQRTIAYMAMQEYSVQPSQMQHPYELHSVLCEEKVVRRTAFAIQGLVNIQRQLGIRA
jgi:hypothetical protein